jgi:uncharacterized protein (TIGR02001 family)
MKKLLMATALTACFATPALADEFSGNVAFTTDYVFRGVSQTDESAAIQGGLDYTHDTGLHAGVWGSSIDFDSVDTGSMELDVYAGFANEYNGFTYDVGAIYYAYPGSDGDLNYDFWEAYFAVGYDFDVLALNAGVYYSPEFFGDTGDAVYTMAGVTVPLVEQFELGAHIGHQSIDDGEDYTDWSFAVNKNWMDFDFSVAYTDTDLDNNDLADERIVFSVSKSF